MSKTNPRKVISPDDFSESPSSDSPVCTHIIHSSRPSFSNYCSRKRRQSNKTRRSATRAEKGKKLSAKERRQGRRHERLSAKQSRRGGNTRLSRRELRRERNLSAREQAAELKALERRLRRPLTKRERAAALRGNSARRRREILEARRRAEAARRAAIARQRAIEKAMRDEAQTFIGRDDTTGEDPEVRRIAVNALGYHAGTVVVMDPITGRFTR